MKKFALAAAMLLAVFVCDALAATLAGRVVGISDGDTVASSAKSKSMVSTSISNRYGKVRRGCIHNTCANFPPKTLYLEVEQQAKSQRAGLWHDAHPEPPWQWRKENRAHHRTGS